jgi:hypothetical protein
LQAHYFTGMYVYVTRNYHPGDLMNCEETGEVVRVERLNTGRSGVAIRIVASLTKASWRRRDDRAPLPVASSVPFRSLKPSKAIAKFFGARAEPDPAPAERKRSAPPPAHRIGNVEHRRTRRARVQIPLLIYGYSAEDGPFSEDGFTVEINAHGALITMKTTVPPGERLLLTNETNQKYQDCTVLTVTSRRRRDVEVTVGFPAAAPLFWCK